MHVLLTDFDKGNLKNYSTENIEEALKSVIKKSNNDTLVGEFGSPTKLDISLTNVSHIITNITLDNRRVYGDVRILNTKMGTKINEYIWDKGIFEFFKHNTFKIRAIANNNDNIKRIFTWDIIPNSELKSEQKNDESPLVSPEEMYKRLYKRVLLTDFDKGDWKYYSTLNIKKVVEDVIFIANTSTLVGEIGPYESDDVDISNASHIIENIILEDRKVYGDIILLNTIQGKILKSLIENNPTEFFNIYEFNLRWIIFETYIGEITTWDVIPKESFPLKIQNDDLPVPFLNVREFKNDNGESAWFVEERCESQPDETLFRLGIYKDGILINEFRTIMKNKDMEDTYPLKFLRK